MLFRTVYGPELGAIYFHIQDFNHQNLPTNRADLYRVFVPSKIAGPKCSTQNVDDAINFLKSAGLLQEHKRGLIVEKHQGAPFSIVLVQALRQLELGQEHVGHPADRVYMALLTELYIKPNQIIVPDLHAAANRTQLVKEIGGLGKEKLQAWARVMEYLGIGRRMHGNFICTYHPSLVLSIIKRWHNQGTLQSFFEYYFDAILPYRTSSGDLSQAVTPSFKELASNHEIELFPLQDSPSRPYFGSLRYKGITYIGIDNDN
jgi:hypothetical protein